MSETHTEWAVEHSQGVYTGDSWSPLTEKRAREWAEANRARDENRQAAYRGRTRLLRREVTEWVPADE